MALETNLKPIFCNAGIFRKRENQLSVINNDEYFKEINKEYKYKRNFFRLFISIIYFIINFFKM